MLEAEIDMLKAIIEEKEEYKCHCIDNEVGDSIKNLEGMACALKQEVETLHLKLDDFKEENISLKEILRHKNELLKESISLKEILKHENELLIEKCHNETELLKKEVRLGKEENKKLRALSNKNMDDNVKLNKELKVFARGDEKRKQEVDALKAQGIKDKGKYEEKVQNIKKSFDKDRNELTSLRSKFKEEEKNSKELTSKHDLFVEKLSDKLECPVCLEVPRAGPVPVCQNGHFVCKQCKKATCPTCRVGMGNGKSLLASIVLENIDHRCRFDACEEYFALDKLDDHAQVCQHRTVSCPYGNCNEEVSILRMIQHLSSSKKCCNYSAACATVKNSLVVMRGYSLKQDVMITDKLCWPTSLFSLDGYGVCIFPEKDGGNFYFSCIMFASEAVCSKYKIEMTVHASKSLPDSDLSFKSVGKPSSIDENQNETKYFGLVVNAKAMVKISRKGDDVFNISLSMKKV